MPQIAHAQLPRWWQQHHPDIQPAPDLKDTLDRLPGREQECDVALLKVPVERRIEVPIADDLGPARLPLDQRIRSQRMMVSPTMLRILPSDPAAFYEPVSSEGADAAISFPPLPAPPVVLLRAAIDSQIVWHRHPAENLRVEVAGLEGIRCLVKVEEWLAFDGVRGELEPRLSGSKKQPRFRGFLFSDLPLAEGLARIARSQRSAVGASSTARSTRSKAPSGSKTA